MNPPSLLHFISHQERLLLSSAEAAALAHWHSVLESSSMIGSGLLFQYAQRDSISLLAYLLGLQ